jgi:superfamily II DNA or RNA helicase
MKPKVAVLLGNRSTVFYPPYPDEIKWYFCFRPAGYRFMPAFKMGRWDGYIKLLKRDKVPTGLFLALRKQIEDELHIEFDVIKMRKRVKLKPAGIVSDRPFQNECIEQMVMACKKYSGGLVLNATGTGKTYIAAMFYSRLEGTGCFLVDELTLMKQAQKEISTVLGEEIGMVGDSEFNPKRITIATSQTMDLHKDRKDFRKWSDKLQVIMVDEIHQAMSRRNFSVIESIEPPVVFGLTATLELKQEHVKMRAHALTGPVVFEYPLARGQAEGFLAPAVAIQLIYDNPDPDSWDAKKKRWTGDYHEQLKQFLMYDDQRNWLIKNLVLAARERKKYTVVLVERIKHLEILSELLEGVPHRVVCGKKEVEDRMADIRKFEAGKIRVILANKVFKKGINIKKLDVIIDAAGMKNKNDAVQKLGRGVRQADGKKGLLYFDIGDNGNRFQVGARRRRSALKSLGIPFKKIDSSMHVQQVFDKAEKMLTKFIQKGTKVVVHDVPEQGHLFEI